MNVHELASKQNQIRGYQKEVIYHKNEIIRLTTIIENLELELEVALGRNLEADT